MAGRPRADCAYAKTSRARCFVITEHRKMGMNLRRKLPPMIYKSWIELFVPSPESLTDLDFRSHRASRKATLAQSSAVCCNTAWQGSLPSRSSSGQSACCFG